MENLKANTPPPLSAEIQERPEKNDAVEHFMTILYGSTDISTIFHRSLTRASEIHTYNTRFASKLNFHRPKANNNYGTSTFAFVSSQLWETIPTNIKRLPYTSFCDQYKLYLLNMQSSEQPVC